MNKYVEKVEQYKEKVLKPALEKLKAEHEEAEDSYRDTGYDRYYKKMQKCESQIEEIEQYLKAGTMEVREVTASEYKELLELRQKNEKHKKQSILSFKRTANVCRFNEPARRFKGLLTNGRQYPSWQRDGHGEIKRQ